MTKKPPLIIQAFDDVDGDRNIAGLHFESFEAGWNAALRLLASGSVLTDDSPTVPMRMSLQIDPPNPADPANKQLGDLGTD